MPIEWCFFGGEISSNFNTKNMISTYTKDFYEDVDQNSANFEGIFFQIANFYDKFNR
jgi:hypothetical protein